MLAFNLKIIRNPGLNEIEEMPDETWDFRVKRVLLGGLGIDAGQRLGMLLVQPLYGHVADGAIAYRISDAYRQGLSQLVEKAFQIRDGESTERCVPIPFIVFPEASIPVRDPDGLDCIRRQMESARGDIIFIGGIEGLSPQEARDLADSFAPGNEISRPAFVGGSFVNMCAIAVKLANGQLTWYFQAKLCPSRWEQRRSMANGQRILYFAGPRVAFLCQICFDLIAAQGRSPLNIALCRQLEEINRPAATTLDFVFVPQSNPKPDAMGESISQLVNYSDRGLQNNMTAVVIVNRAAEMQEAYEYGRSGFHWKTNRWQIPRSDLGPKGYELNDKYCVTSAVFRKRTPAIHVATLLPQSHNIGDTGNLRHPLENPRSYLIAGECDETPCSCLPGELRTAGSFVECKCLPCKLRDTLTAGLPRTDTNRRWQTSDEAQSERLSESYDSVRKQFLTLSCERAGELLDLLLHKYEDKKAKANPDTWVGPRPQAVVELLAALCVLHEWRQPLSLDSLKGWTAYLGDSFAVVAVDGEDDKHSWTELEVAYRREFESLYFRPDMRERAVLFIALRSKGCIVNGVKRSQLEFSVPISGTVFAGRPETTGHKEPRFWICQASLLEQARLEGSIRDFLECKFRCIHG